MTRARFSSVALALLAFSPACSGKKADPDALVVALSVAGLDAVPVDASSIIAMDLDRVTSSPLVDRGIDLIANRSPGLRARFARIASTCKLAVGENLHQVVVALGPLPAPTAPATTVQPVMMVVRGSVDEAAFTECVRGMVGVGGGVVTESQKVGRQIYRVDDAGRSVWFSYGQADTLILSTSEPWLIDGLSKEPKVATDKTWQALLANADRTAPIWGAGAVSPKVSAGVVRVTGGEVNSGPQHFVIALDPTSGARVKLAAVMPSAADATVLAEMGQSQLGLMEKAAQAWRLGTLVAKITMRADGELFWLEGALTPEEVEQVLVVIDRAGAPPQDAPP